MTSWRQYVQRIPIALWQVALHAVFFALATGVAAVATAPLLLLRCIDRVLRSLLWAKHAVPGRKDVIVILGADTPLGEDLIKLFVAADETSDGKQGDGPLIVAYGADANRLHEAFDRFASVKVVRGNRYPSATDAERLAAVVSQSSRYLLAVLWVTTASHTTSSGYAPPKTTVALIDEVCTSDAALEASALLTVAGVLTPLLLSAAHSRQDSQCSAAPRFCHVAPAPTSHAQRAANDLCQAALQMLTSRLTFAKVEFRSIKVASATVPVHHVKAAVLDAFSQAEVRVVASPIAKLVVAARVFDWARVALPEAWGLRKYVRRLLSRLK